MRTAVLYSANRTKPISTLCV